MTPKCTLLLLAAGSALLISSGCSKQEAPPAPPANEAAKMVTPAASDAAKTVEAAKPVEAPKNIPQEAPKVEAPKPAADAAVSQAQTAAPAAATATQGLIDKAKTLMQSEKYQEALLSLEKLAGSKLTPDQQKMVDSLKTQIQAALTKQAAGSALDSVLGGKK